MYYMGVNAGAFLGIMLCGYIGEKFLELVLD
jgi:POT family proton-dependent oligopeptide transporter